METAEDRRADDLAAARIDTTWERAVPVERRVWALLVVVGDELAQRREQVPRAERDDVVGALATDRADHPLDVGIHHRHLASDAHRPDAYRLELAAEGVSIDAVPIVDQKAGERGIAWERLDNLLRRPLGCKRL